MKPSLTRGGQQRIVVVVWPVLRDVLQHEANQTTCQSDQTALMEDGEDVGKKSSKNCMLLQCAIGRVWQMLSFFLSLNPSLPTVLCQVCIQSLKIAWNYIWMQMYFGKKKKMLPSQHRQISSVQFSSCNILLCFRSWSGCSENSSLSLCLITVLSFQPVEFSRNTLSPSPSRDSNKQEKRNLSMCLLL